MNILHLIFAWLLASSLRASLLALAVVCLQVALGRWLPARWRYALWLPVLLVLVAPILPATRWSLENCFAHKPSPLTATSDTVTASLPPGAETPLEAPSSAPTGSAMLDGRDLLLTAWLLGASGMLAAGAIGYRRTLLRLARNQVETPFPLCGAVASAAAQIGLTRLPRVLVSTAVESPAVAGLLRPTLLLPASFPEGFSPAEARLILLHELTHLKAWDLPLNWLLCLLQALHWFNPLLWIAFARIRADREAVCDARVLSADAGDRRADYGQALLKLQDIAPRFSLSLAFVGMFERAGIRSRIRSIGRHRHRHPAWSAVAVAIIAGLLLLGATRAQSGTAMPTVTSGVLLPQIEIDSHVVEVPTGLPLHLKGGQTSETIGGKTEHSAYLQSAGTSEAFFKEITGMKGVNILSSPRITTLSGRQANVSVGQDWKPSPNSKPLFLGESLDINPKVQDKNIVLYVTFAQSKLVDMRVVPAHITGTGQARMSGTAILQTTASNLGNRTGTLIISALQTTASNLGNRTGTLIISATASPMEAQTGVNPGAPGTGSGNPPWQKGMISSVVQSKVAMKDGETLVLTEPVAGTSDKRLLVFLTARIVDAAENPVHPAAAR